MSAFGGKADMTVYGISLSPLFGGKAAMPFCGAYVCFLPERTSVSSLTRSAPDVPKDMPLTGWRKRSHQETPWG